MPDDKPNTKNSYSDLEIAAREWLDAATRYAAIKAQCHITGIPYMGFIEAYQRFTIAEGKLVAEVGRKFSL